MKRTIALLLLLFTSSLANAANTWGTDVSDMWWNPSESGWGANIAHQREIVFVTLYVYGADSRVRWYVGPNLGNTSGFIFSGTLYETTGPYLGGAFNPNSVSTRVVGTVTVNIATVNTGTLSYTVDGVSVTKSIERQTFRTADISGSYAGAMG